MKTPLVLVLSLLALPAFATERAKPTVVAAPSVHLLPSEETVSNLSLLEPSSRREDLHRSAAAMGYVGLGLGAVSAGFFASSALFADGTPATLFETAARAEERRASQRGFVTASGAIATAAVSSLVVALVLEVLSER